MPLSRDNLFNIRGVIELEFHYGSDVCDEASLLTLLDALRREQFVSAAFPSVESMYRDPQRWFPVLSISSAQLTDVRLTMRIFLYDFVKQHIGAHSDLRSSGTLLDALDLTAECLRRDLAKMPQVLCITLKQTIMDTFDSLKRTHGSVLLKAFITCYALFNIAVLALSEDPRAIRKSMKYLLIIMCAWLSGAQLFLTPRMVFSALPLRRNTLFQAVSHYAAQERLPAPAMRAISI